jgi:hypothetical protein
VSSVFVNFFSGLIFASATLVVVSHNDLVNVEPVKIIVGEDDV